MYASWLKTQTLLCWKLPLFWTVLRTRIVSLCCENSTDGQVESPVPACILSPRLTAAWAENAPNVQRSCQWAPPISGMLHLPSSSVAVLAVCSVAHHWTIERWRLVQGPALQHHWLRKKDISSLNTIFFDTWGWQVESHRKADLGREIWDKSTYTYEAIRRYRSHHDNSHNLSALSSEVVFTRCPLSRLGSSWERSPAVCGVHASRLV